MSKILDIQIQFSGKSPVIKNAAGKVDKRTTLVNIAKMIRGIDDGTRIKNYGEFNQTFVQTQENVVAATGTVTCAAVAAADTVSVGGTALTATQLRASGTLTISSGSGAVGGTINGTLITVTWATSDTASATALAAAINASTDPHILGVVEASSAAGVVTVYSKSIGTAGNAYTLVASGTGVTASGSGTLANGAAPANNQFDYIGTNNETAADLARAVNASTSANVKQATASAASAVVTLTSVVGGLAGNTVALATSNNTRLAKSGTTLANGAADAANRFSY